MGKRRGAYRISVGRPRHSEMILKWIFKKWGGGID